VGVEGRREGLGRWCARTRETSDLGGDVLLHLAVCRSRRKPPMCECVSHDNER
jgi:hypothetical protein